MLVDAIYDHGKLKFVQPIKLKHERIKVVVNIPDEELEEQKKVKTVFKEDGKYGSRLMARLEAIRKEPMIDSFPPVSQRMLDRLEAMEVRDELREGEDGEE